MTNSSDNRLIAKAYESMRSNSSVKSRKPSVSGTAAVDADTYGLLCEQMARQILERVFGLLDGYVRNRGNANGFRDSDSGVKYRGDRMGFTFAGYNLDTRRFCDDRVAVADGLMSSGRGNGFGVRYDTGRPVSPPREWETEIADFLMSNKAFEVEHYDYDVGRSPYYCKVNRRIELPKIITGDNRVNYGLWIVLDRGYYMNLQYMPGR